MNDQNDHDSERVFKLEVVVYEGLPQQDKSAKAKMVAVDQVTDKTKNNNLFIEIGQQRIIAFCQKDENLMRLVGVLKKLNFPEEITKLLFESISSSDSVDEIYHKLIEEFSYLAEAMKIAEAGSENVISMHPTDSLRKAAKKLTKLFKENKLDDRLDSLQITELVEWLKHCRGFRKDFADEI